MSQSDGLPRRPTVRADSVTSGAAESDYTERNRDSAAKFKSRVEPAPSGLMTVGLMTCHDRG